MEAENKPEEEKTWKIFSWGLCILINLMSESNNLWYSGCKQKVIYEFNAIILIILYY